MSFDTKCLIYPKRELEASAKISANLVNYQSFGILNFAFSFTMLPKSLWQTVGKSDQVAAAAAAI